VNDATQSVLKTLDRLGNQPRESCDGWSAEGPAADSILILSVHAGDKGGVSLCRQVGRGTFDVVKQLGFKTAVTKLRDDIDLGATVHRVREKPKTVWDPAVIAVAALEWGKGVSRGE